MPHRIEKSKQGTETKKKVQSHNN